MKKYLICFVLPLLMGCNDNSKNGNDSEESEPQRPLTAVEKYYHQHVNDSIKSKSVGSVGRGSLEHATLIPFEGENYAYFDKNSYLGRSRLHAQQSGVDYSRNV